MIYAAKLQATDSAITIGIDGQPVDGFYAFPNIAEMRKHLNELWKNEGQNLVRIPRKKVEQYYGRDFVVLSNGLVWRNEN